MNQNRLVVNIMVENSFYPPSDDKEIKSENYIYLYIYKQQIINEWKMKNCKRYKTER